MRLVPVVIGPGSPISLPRGTKTKSHARPGPLAEEGRGHMDGATAGPMELPPESMAVLARLADPSSGLWEACGYQPFPLGPLTARPAPVRPDTGALAEARSRYDVVIVGSGAGGGVAARVLAEAGASVLIVERGGWLGRDAPGLDHLRTHRLTLLGDGTSPDGHPRTRTGSDGEEVTIGPLDADY